MHSRVVILPSAALSASQPSKTREPVQNSSKQPENAQVLPFLTLPHPRTGNAALFLPYEVNASGDGRETEVQILEVQAISPSAERSWFMEDDTILEDGRLLLMTPIDPAFLLLPLLQLTFPDNTTHNFRTIDDIFEVAAQKLTRQEDDSNHDKAEFTEQDILQLSTFDCISSALLRVCETKDLDNETRVYRLSLPNVLETLRVKVTRLATPEFASNVQAVTRQLAADGLGTRKTVEESLREAGRTKVACQLLSQYLPPPIYEALLASYDFTALNKHIRTAADVDFAIPPSGKTHVGMHSKSDNNSKGASKNTEASKKRKAETQASKGAAKLAKTDTSKMAKLTTFFAKKPA